MRRTVTILALCLLLITPLRGFGQTGAMIVSPDSDGDGLTDAQEDANGNGVVDTNETDPFNADMDGGGEADGAEIQAGRNPLDRKDDYTYDLDNDGLVNGEEAAHGTNPSNPDTDRDGLNDADDAFPRDSRYRTDANGDGIPDEYAESLAAVGEEPIDPNQDDDNDGLTNSNEFLLSTDPTNADTDLDGMTDGVEVQEGSDPTLNACLFSSDPTLPFSDLSGHWAREYVEPLHRTGAEPSGNRIIEGYGTGRKRFLPDRAVTRFEFLKIALLGNCVPLGETFDGATQTFSDLPSAPPSGETADQALRRRVIYTGLQEGIIEGYPDGTVRPDANVNRAEALKMLLLTGGLSPATGSGTALTFADVPEEAWFASYVHTAVEEQLIEGYEDGTFRPGQLLTRAEAGKILFLLIRSNPAINGDALPEDS
ncbi:MAG: S-layer homology domain-containing protein [Candidatus Peribacteraceae bacterium]|nr:S-layer homology domain-containing protein [Candidatus Peribacteraceae bacterium]